MIVGLIDYGVGNLHSLAKAIEAGGATARIETHAARALEADAIVLPGVGAFGAAADKLASSLPALRAALAAGKPCLGICLGMQLLFESSEEGEGEGIGAFRGKVTRLRGRRVPHMGWNMVENGPDPIFEGLDSMVAYYANSYIAEPESVDDVIAWTDYQDCRFAAAVRRGRTWGVQFHPEKSDRPGLQLIRNFLREAAA
jgi:imidazole glycerol-phosphate synthase subunit HisH